MSDQKNTTSTGKNAKVRIDIIDSHASFEIERPPGSTIQKSDLSFLLGRIGSNLPAEIPGDQEPAMVFGPADHLVIRLASSETPGEVRAYAHANPNLPAVPFDVIASILRGLADSMDERAAQGADS